MHREFPRRITRILTLGVILFAPSACDVAAHEAEPRKVIQVFAPMHLTAGARTAYGTLAKFIECEMNKAKPGGYEFQAVSTAGSLDSLLRLDATRPGSDAIALSQSDVLYHYLEGGHNQFPGSRKVSRVRAIARVFPEWLFLTHHGERQSGATDEEVIAGVQRVWGGRQGSGTLVTALNLARTLALPWYDELLPLRRPTSAAQRNGVAFDAARGLVPWSGAVFPVFESRDPPDLSLSVISPSSIQFTGDGEFLFVSETSSSLIAEAYPGAYVAIPWTADEGKTSVESLLTEREGVDRILSPAWKPALESKGGDARPGALAVSCILTCTDSLDPVVVNALDALLARVYDGPAPRSRDERAHEDRPDRALVVSRTGYGAYEASGDDARTKKLPIALHPHLRLTKEVLDRDPVTNGLYTLASLRPWKISLIFLVFLVLSPFLYTGAWRLATGAKVAFRMPWPVAEWAHRMQGASRGVVRLFGWVLGRVVRSWSLCAQYRNWLFVGAGILAAHVVVGAAVWLSEFYSSSPVRETEIATKGATFAMLEVGKLTTTGQHPVLRSDWAHAWIVLLKGGYALAGIALTFDVGRRLSNWTRNQFMSKHVIIVGWNQRGKRLVHELKEQSVEVQVVSKCPPNEFLGGNSDQMLTPPGDLAKTLSQLNAARARAIIVLAETYSGSQDETDLSDSQADVQTMAALGAISEYLESSKDKNPELRLIVEVRNDQLIPAMRQAGAHEVVCQNWVASELIAHAATKAAVVPVFRELLETSKETNEIYSRRLSAAERKKLKKFKSREQRMPTFLEAVQLLVADRSEGSEWLPIGVRRRDNDGVHEVMLNPIEERETREAADGTSRTQVVPFAMSLGDELVYLARRGAS